MTALIVLSQEQAKLIVAQAIACKLKDSAKRVYVAYGSTNQMILRELGINIPSYHNGYIERCLSVNNNKPAIVILNGKESTFLESINNDDIVIKGANALSYENGKYKAAVAVASLNGGTYGDVVVNASIVGAKVIIPVTHEKLVPTLLSGIYHQDSFDFVEDIAVALVEYRYGQIYTEIDALMDTFSLKAQIYLSGGIKTNNRSLTFVVNGSRGDIDNLLKWKEDVE